MYNDDPPEFYTRTQRKSKGVYACVECSRYIGIDETYLQISGKWGGKVRSFRSHVECEQFLKLLNDVLDADYAHGDLNEARAEYYREFGGRGGYYDHGIWRLVSPLTVEQVEKRIARKHNFPGRWPKIPIKQRLIAYKHALFKAQRGWLAYESMQAERFPWLKKRVFPGMNYEKAEFIKRLYEERASKTEIRQRYWERYNQHIAAKALIDCAKLFVGDFTKSPSQQRIVIRKFVVNGVLIKEGI